MPLTLLPAEIGVMHVDVILPQLLVGSCPRSRADVEQLHNESGVSAVLSLQSDADLQHLGIDWRDLSAYYRQLGIDARRTPVQDFNAAALRDSLPRCVLQLAELLRDGRTVYVHCTAGINRSPSTIIAYLHWIEGMELGEAVWMVTSRHPCDPYVSAIVQATAGWQELQAAE